MDGSRIVFDGAWSRAWLHGPGAQSGRAEGRTLAVTFIHMGGSRTRFAEPKPVRRFLSQGADHLQVLTARNDWYLNDDLEALCATLTDLTAPYERVVAIGFSMGGYAALRLSRSLRLTQAILVSPQSTPFSDEPPFDPRYQVHEGKCRRDLALTGADIRPEMRGFVLYDPRLPDSDRAHAKILAAMSPAITPVAMPFGGHPCTAPIQDAGLWEAFQDMLLARPLTTAHLAGLRRQARFQSRIWNRAALSALRDREARQETGF